MLTLVGMGLWSAADISLAGLETLKRADLVYAEQYTSKMREGTLAELEALCGKKITALSREEVEGEKTILAQAASRNVALLVPGDPMISTTHTSLVLAARKKGIKVQVVHAASILTAVLGETGLHSYKIGRPVTLAAWLTNYKPMTTYETIADNLSRGLHTLLFLDIDEKTGPMRPPDALHLLQKMEEAGGKKVIGKSTPLIIACRIGSETQKISYGPLATLAKKDLGQPPCIIIVPGPLHFTEKDFLETFK